MDYREALQYVKDDSSSWSETPTRSLIEEEEALAIVEFVEENLDGFLRSAVQKGPLQAFITATFLGLAAERHRVASLQPSVKEVVIDA